MNMTGSINTLWMWSCHREWRRFRSAASQPAKSQASLLRQMLRSNANTEYGRRHGFSNIRTPQEYQQRVPLADYQTLSPWIERAAAGRRNVLTREAVRLFEPTSGSSSVPKLIPYTRALQRQFQRMIGAWIYNLFHTRPGVRKGRAYWSISPALGPPQHTSGGLPIGFETDAEYLGGLGRYFLKRVLAVPPEVARQPDIAEFQFATLCWLLSAADLSLVSVWSPTFLTSLLSRLDERTDQLCARIRARDPHRARDVAAILNSTDSIADKLNSLWPGLTLISCWADASARAHLPAVRRLFPSVEIQPKGLLATEACVSFPLVGRNGGALALWSHFYEFEQLSPGAGLPTNDRCLFAHQLDVGRRYAVVVTTGGGLYRYRLHDVVEVVGFEEECPLLEFHGRNTATVDLVGDKLAEPHVREVLNRTFDQLQLSPDFALVAPVLGPPLRYRLYIQVSCRGAPGRLSGQLPQLLQSGLEENPHYRYACQLGQLDPIDVRWLTPVAGSAWQLYEQHRRSQGIRHGDIKPTTLDTQGGWDDVFASCLPESSDPKAATVAVPLRTSQRG